MSKPFLKWAGGKGQLIDNLTARKPDDYNRYVELMVGGGALLFHLEPQSAIINDINPELINAYMQVKQAPANVWSELSSFEQSPEAFYEIRGADRTEQFAWWTAAKKAARTIYLNKLSYNGLYRVNSKGMFNAPHGKRTVSFTPDFINDASRVLQNVEIHNLPYQGLLPHLRVNDWVYIDPPYMPLNETSNFTQYTSAGFSTQNHLELKEFCDTLSERGIKFLMSNSATDSVRELYGNYTTTTVMARRSINSVGSRRGPIPELLISNY